MDTDVLVALISAAAALIVAITTAAWGAVQSNKAAKAQDKAAKAQAKTARDLEKLRAKLAATQRQEARQEKARVVLNKYREPLVDAAADLLSRLDNMTKKGFIGYLDSDDHHGEIARRSTQFRVAVYFGWIEALARRSRYLHFETDRDTREVSKLLAAVGKAFASDGFRDGKGGQGLMLWREEQRAIGGLMQGRDGSSGVIGFEDFMERYSEFEAWLGPFVEDLRDPEIFNGGRLARIETTLSALVERLDEEGRYPRSADPSVITPTAPERAS
jgi:hypothetical protein